MFGLSKRIEKSTLVVAVAVVAVAVALALAAPEAELGQKAGPLEIAKWVKGDPVKLADGQGKTVYVVEFWATWCGPCRVSIPHLTEMQKKYKDRGVVFVGISSEKADTVEAFVEKMGDKMDYAVAVDDNGKTTRKYMNAFGVGGIPHAFVVNKQGEVVWHGHPMGRLEETLDQVLEGTYDITAVQRQQQALELANDYFRLVMQPDKAEEAVPIAEKVLEMSKGFPSVKDRMAWTILSSDRIQSRDLDMAMKFAKAAVDETDGKDPSVLDTYARALFDTGKVKEAIATAEKAVKLSTNDRMKKAFQTNLDKYKTARKR